MPHLEETLEKNLAIIKRLVPLTFRNVKTAKLRKTVTNINIERRKQKSFIAASNVKLRNQIADQDPNHGKAPEVITEEIVTPAIVEEAKTAPAVEDVTLIQVPQNPQGPQQEKSLVNDLTVPVLVTIGSKILFG